MEIEFCLLGPLMVRSGTAVTPVPRGKQRTVLAALLLSAGHVVSLEELAVALWGDQPPPTARVAIQNHVMRLRHSLGDAGSRIRTHPPGYLIRVEAGEVDVIRFGAHADAARAAARDGAWGDAAAEAGAALALWRGEPLADAGSEALALREVPRLAEMRLQALETRIDADLHLGRHPEVITELRQLVAAHPLRERFHGLLMLALYQDGRQGEALATYQQTRAMLVEELGTEPGAALSRVHRQILTGDPALMMPEPALGTAGGTAPTQVRLATGPSTLAASAREAPTREATTRAQEAEPGLPPAPVDVFPVAIGYYTDADLTDLDVETSVGRLVDLLAPFGGRHRPWRHPARDRGADAVQRRLREWPSPLAGSSVLYWAGHGWSDGTRTALAHAQSPVVVGGSGLEPQQLAQAIRARQADGRAREQAGDAGGWTMVIVETSHATQIADAVMAALHGPDAPARLLLVAVPGDGTVPAGEFTAVLTNLLAGTYRAERRILLRDLAAQLERVLGPGNVYQRALGEAALVRIYPPAASWMSAPVDTIRCLEEVLEDLSPDERSHFVAKAQGGEHGELSWFFEGRENELAQISAWLHEADSGLLAVTGRAGAGKSALLGTVLVRSLPALRDALARRGLTASGPEVAALPESVFDAVILLSGLDLAQALTRTASAAGIGPLPSDRDPEADVASDLDFLAGQLADRAGPFTLLADALDESADPLDIARSLLARMAALPGVRVLVGTRGSTSEAPDTPASDQDLLDALGTGTAGSRVIWVGRDQQAIGRYVTGRLRAARDYGVAGRAVPHLREVSDQDIARVADEVADRGQEFLFAQLAVYELIADPRLLAPGLAGSRGQLLEGSHQDLFGRALHRLAGQDDRYPVLMRALSLARGRGIPEADGLWAAIAAALAGPGAAAGWAEAISGLLGQAAAYIIVDTSTGSGPAAKPETVYRLAHRTFAEYFASHPPAAPDAGDPRRLAAEGLLRAARAVATGPDALPGYLAKHLSGHAAEAGMWDELAALPAVLDRIDPGAVTTDAIRTLFGHRPIPPPIAGIIGARDILATAKPADRPGLRQLSTTIHSARQVISEPVVGWGIAAARAGRCTVHVRLKGHTGAVSRVRSLTLPDGRVVLASCSDDGTIRLWDSVTATPVGMAMNGHTSTVEDICVLPAPGGSNLLASAGGDGTVRLWDPATSLPAGPVLTGHTGPVYGVCAVPGSGPGQPPALATAGHDGTVRLWDPATGQPAGPVLTGHTGPVCGVCAVPGSGPGQPPALATAGHDGTVRLWDPATGLPAGPVLTGHTGPVYRVCTVPGRGSGHPPALASAGEDGTVRLWDPDSGQPGPVLTGHTSPVCGVCTVPGSSPGQPPALATAGHDGTVRLWDPATGLPAGPVLTGHTGPIYGVCTVPGQPPALATAGEDRTVRLWDPATGQPAGPVFAGQTSPMCGQDGTVRLRDPATGRAIGQLLTRSPQAVRALARCAAEIADCVTAHGDGTVRTWTAATATQQTLTCPPDVSAIATVTTGNQLSLLAGDVHGRIYISGLRTGDQPGPPLRVDGQAVLDLCPLPSQSRDARVAAAGGSGIVTIITISADGQLSPGPILLGPPSPIRALCLITHPHGRPLLAAAGNDAAIRIWDLSAIGAATPDTRPPATPVTGPLTGHDGWIWSLAAIPAQPGTPPRLASASADHTIRLWDPLTGRALGQPLTGHSGTVRAITTARSDDGQTILVSGGHDGTIRLWDPATGTPLAVIPLGIPVHALLQQHPDPQSRKRTDGGATITAGLRTGILALDLHHDLFQPRGTR
jgi:WD40 repeat protein/DNA-binding SARP family transcriptional activator